MKARMTTRQQIFQNNKRSRQGERERLRKLRSSPYRLNSSVREKSYTNRDFVYYLLLFHLLKIFSSSFAILFYLLLLFILSSYFLPSSLSTLLSPPSPSISSSLFPSLLSPPPSSLFFLYSLVSSPRELTRYRDRATGWMAEERGLIPGRATAPSLTRDHPISYQMCTGS